MRGNALADPTVVGLLQPFVISYWYGHGDDGPPDGIRDLVIPSRGGPMDREQLPGGHSNVKIAILDSAGALVDAFDCMPEEGAGPWQESMPRWFAERLRQARKTLGVTAHDAGLRPLAIPDRTGDERAVRVFVRLADRNMPAYAAPVVEVAEPSAEDWAALAWPEQARTVDAAALLACFRHVYPPGVMERQNKRTMFHYRVAKAEGALTLEPGGIANGVRYALLRGTVKLTDEGTDDFSYEGTLSAVLSYGKTDGAATSLRGTFEAEYPRYDHRRKSWSLVLPLTAVLESLPAGE